MSTLHIEHTIVDFELWNQTFGSRAAQREQAGVRGERVLRPVDDPNYLLIDLDFDSTAAAAQFLSFLETKIWSSCETAPTLVGHPKTMIVSPA